jgi:hypothetical protein
MPRKPIRFINPGLLFFCPPDDPPEGGAGGGGGGQGPDGAGGSGGGGGEPERGYPADTPVSAMTDAQKANYYLAQSRKWEDQARGKSDPQTDYLKDLAAKAAKAAELEAAGQSEHEKATAAAVEAAKKETREQTLREASSNTAKTLLEGALKVRGMKASDVDEAIKFANLGAFVKDGEIDHDALVAHADRLAGTPGGSGPRDFGGGRRGERTGTRPGDAGRAEAERRYGKKQDTTISS